METFRIGIPVVPVILGFCVWPLVKQADACDIAATSEKIRGVYAGPGPVGFYRSSEL